MVLRCFWRSIHLRNQALSQKWFLYTTMLSHIQSKIYISIKWITKTLVWWSGKLVCLTMTQFKVAEHLEGGLHPWMPTYLQWWTLKSYSRYYALFQMEKYSKPQNQWTNTKRTFNVAFITVIITMTLVSIFLLKTFEADSVIIFIFLQRFLGFK